MNLVVVDGKTLFKTRCRLGGNLEENGDIENKLDRITDQDGMLMYIKVFIKMVI